MGVIERRVRKKQRERILREAAKAAAKSSLGKDVSEGSIKVELHEKRGLTEVMLEATRWAVSAFLRILAVLFCALGLIAAVYPGPRRELFLILTKTVSEAKGFLGF